MPRNEIDPEPEADDLKLLLPDPMPFDSDAFEWLGTSDIHKAKSGAPIKP